MKKIISAGLATILAVSALSTAAFAEEYTMTAESTLAKPAVKVTMPKSMAFVFNPYGLKVNAKGAIDASGQEGTLIGSYAFATETGADTSGWAITNGTGTPLKAAVYAYAENKDGAEFVVVDKAATPATSAKRSLKVALTAKADEGDAADITLGSAKLDTKTASIWDTDNGSTVIDSVETKLVVSFDNENSVATKADTDVWSDKDAVKLNFIFGFELADGSTGGSGGGSGSSYTGTGYTITWVAKNGATLSKDSSTIAADTATTTSDIATITAVEDTDSYKAEVLKYTIKISDEETKTFNDAAALIAYLDGLDTRANVSVNVFAKTAD